MILTRPSIEKWLRDNFAKYDPKKMIVTCKAEGNLIVFSEGELIAVNYLAAGYRANLDFLKTKIEEYFETGVWDKNYYYIVCQSDASFYKPNPLKGAFVKLESGQVGKIRIAMQSTGLYLVSVNKDRENWLSYDEFMKELVGNINE